VGHIKPSPSFGVTLGQGCIPLGDAPHKRKIRHHFKYKTN
jgi:hypothetical protein